MKLIHSDTMTATDGAIFLNTFRYYDRNRRCYFFIG